VGHALGVDRPEDLDGDRAARCGVAGVEHLCHLAASQQVLDLMALVDQHPGSSTGMISYG
jgi:hypothetical protein